MRILVLIGIFLFQMVSVSVAYSIPEDTAVRIIVGEAADQGPKGMLCVAEVIRHRGNIKDFYGYKRHMKKEPAYIWKAARKAWTESAHTNYTRGADHFENIHAFGTPSWVKHCVRTYTYKDHIFYKEIG